MPKYKYVCVRCDCVYKIDLPISFDPGKKLNCPECLANNVVERRIGRGAEFPRKVGKVWAGDWFERTYGHDIAEDAQDRVRQREHYEKEVRELESMGIKMKISSERKGMVKLPPRDEKDS